MRKSFTEFSRNYLYEKIENRLREYVERDGADYQGMKIDFQNTYDISCSKLGLDIKVGCEVSRYDRVSDDDSMYQDSYLVQCEISVYKNNYSFSVNSISPFSGMPCRKYKYDDSIVPLMLSEEEYVDTANRILQEYYPEHLEKAEPLDGLLLAERMGLTVVERDIHQPGVRARIFLTDGEFEGERYKAGTIIIKSQSDVSRKLESINYDIVHECVHWFCHRKQALLESVLMDTPVCCDGGDVECVLANWHNPIIEKQANKIAGLVLTPETTLQTLIDNFFQSFAQPVQQEDYLQIMPQLLELVCKTYFLSVTAGRIRLQQTGLELIDGISNFVDGHYVENYVFNREALPQNGIRYTYTISQENIGWLLEVHDKLRSLVEDHSLIVVDNHIVVNAPKYLEYGKTGVSLSYYALTHMDECAVPFLTCVNVFPSPDGAMTALSRKPRSMSVAHCDLDENYSLSKILDNDVVQEVVNEVNGLSEDFRKNIRLLTKARRVT